MSKKFPFWREGTFFAIGMTMDNPLNRTSRFINSTDLADTIHFGRVVAGGGGRTIQLDGRIEF